jgi:hypothetical protein
MPKNTRRSKEFSKFDAMVGALLSVPKTELDARVAAHKKQAALNPRKRGPKPKVKRAESSVHVAGGEAES